MIKRILCFLLAAAAVFSSFVFVSSPIHPAAEQLPPRPVLSPSPVPTAAPSAAPTHTPVPTPTPSPTPVPTPSPQPYKTAELREYGSGVEKGTVRYVHQLGDVEENGWGIYAWKAGMECTTACISMAVSYLGIDASPEDILNYSSQTVLASTYGIEEISASPLTAVRLSAEDAFPVFEEMFRQYSEDENTSPVLIYLSGNGHYHALLVIGRAGEHEYLVADPTPYGVHRIEISEKGEISTSEEGYLERYTNSGEQPAQINSLAQWYAAEPDAVA